MDHVAQPIELPASSNAAFPARAEWQADRSEKLILRVLQADASPAALAAEFGMTMPELAAWIADPGNSATLKHLARLADIRAQVLLSQFRANAAVQLIQIATAHEASELSRKACVDLLKANLRAFEVATAGKEPSTPPLPTLDEEAMYRILDRLGADESEFAATHNETSSPASLNS